MRLPPTLPTWSGFGASCPGLLNTEFGPPQICPGLRTNELSPPQICPGLLMTEFGPPAIWASVRRTKPFLPTRSFESPKQPLPPMPSEKHLY